MHQALLPPLISALASVSELSLIGALPASPSPLRSPLSALLSQSRRAPVTVLPITSDFRGPSDLQIQSRSANSHPESTKRDPYLAQILSTSPLETHSAAMGMSLLVLLAALLWPCGAGLPYAAISALTLGAWAMGSGFGEGGSPRAPSDNLDISASTHSTSGGSRRSSLIVGSHGDKSPDSTRQRSGLTLLFLLLYCCSHLLLQYAYMVRHLAVSRSLHNHLSI